MAVPSSLQDTFQVTDDDGAPGGSTWRSNSEILFKMYSRSTEDAQEQQRKLYPTNYQNHVARTVPWVWRVARELGGSLYLREPSRDFVFRRNEVGGDEGSPLPDATQRLINRVYKGADVNSWLKYCHELTIATGNAAIFVMPLPTVLGVRLVCPPIHQVEVALDDPFSTSELDVSKAWFRVPLGRDPESNLTTYGVAEITRETATWVDGPLSGRGIYAEDGSNPIGEVPLIQLRRSPAEPGRWFSAEPADLLDAQRALNHDYTDLGTISRLQGFAQGYIKGMDAESVSNLQGLGPNSFVGLWEEAELGFASPSPDLKGYLDQVESYVRTVTSVNSLNPSSLMNKSAGATAISKLVELQDREIERATHENQFIRAEQRLYRLMSKWINHLRGQPNLLPPADVKVTYRHAEPPTDPLHSAQSSELRIKLGLSSSVSELMTQRGLTREEATRLVQENIAETSLISGGGRTLLNGAQVTAALLVGERVGAGSLTVEGGSALLVDSLGITEATALRFLKGAGPITEPSK
tara:strand:+ start:500 stop:2071 length:1572 start_codon:yes stop_codon:yes gene_type:complete